MAAYQHIRFKSADGRLNLYARDYGGGGLPVLCLHGLTRNSADFEALAARLSPRYRVIAPDVRGRGLSDYDPEPMNYQPGVYVQDVFALLKHLDLARCVVIGTSMGGIMGMIMAAMAPQSLIGLALNDVGPELDPAGLARIAAYAGKVEPARGWAEAADRCRASNGQAFPDYGEADWLAFARRTYRETPEGPAPAYDPDIAVPFKAAEGAAPPDMWGLWDALAAIPMLAIRGALSDLLAQTTLEQMQARHPALATATIPGRGHAPMLDEPEAATAINAFLQAMETRS
jgi:pimeloyl-ACP methyl ester carboxylesterase